MDINIVKDFIAQQRGLIFPGSGVLIYLPESVAAAAAQTVEALGGLPRICPQSSSYAELKTAMDELRPELCIAEPVRLLSMLRACGRGSLRRALVISPVESGSVINEIEDILTSPLVICPQGDKAETAALDEKLFSLGALVDCKISALKSGGYKLEGIYSGWMDARQIIDICPEIVAVKLRELSMDDVPMYSGERAIM